MGCICVCVYMASKRSTFAIRGFGALSGLEQMKPRKRQVQIRAPNVLGFVSRARFLSHSKHFQRQRGSVRFEVKAEWRLIVGQASPPKQARAKAEGFQQRRLLFGGRKHSQATGLKGRRVAAEAKRPAVRPPVLPSTRLGCPLPVGTATEALLLPLPHWRSKSAKAGNHTASFRCAGALLPAAVRRPTLLMQHT